MKKYDFIFLLIILLTSFLLGSRMILSGDFFYLFDQARDGLIVKDIIDTKNLTLIGTHSGLGGFFHGPLWLYMLVPVYILGQGDPLAFAYFYIGLQLITVFIAFICGERLYGVKGGLLIAILVALSPVTWAHVPNTIGVNAVPLVFLGLFYFLVKFVRGDSRSFIFASFFAGLSLQFETALPMVLLPAMIVTFFINRKAITNVRVIALSIFSYLISVSSFVLFEIRHKFMMSNAVLGAFGKGKREKGYLELADRIPSHISSLLDTYKELLFISDRFLTALFAVIAAYSFILILKNKKDKYKKEFFFLFFFPALIFLFFIFYSYKIWPEYAFGLIVPIAFAFYISFSTIWKTKIGKILSLLFFAYTFFNVSIFIHNQYFNKDFVQNKTAGSYKNQVALVKWIYEDAGNNKFGYLVYTPESYTHGMDYLFSWNSKFYSGSTPVNTKERTTYLIMYPPLTDDKEAHSFWKKNVVRTEGKVLLKKQFLGGITVEKLHIDKNEPEVDPNYYQGLIFR